MGLKVQSHEHGAKGLPIPKRNNPPLFKGTHDLEGAQITELDGDGVAISWTVFRRAFPRRYFPEDVRGRKEIEFLKLKQGNMMVPEYASKFVKLEKFYTHYNTDESIEFSNRIFEEDNVKLKSSHSRQLVDKRGKKPMDRGNPYDKGNSKAGDYKRPSRGDSSPPVRCYNCGETGHRRNECKSREKKCIKYGKEGHIASDCRMNTVTCYNYGEEGHISS
ncbi:uncharacterized protein LOC131659869 [Vicia villosa]|uniref:uncharacterized protein LOC131659869 n=1 Tax=Vicia villosa TaxID=3911 RepID=UPI00273C4212|nr:uncharacterized protein LOC131659869 [Vicia villosa]